MPARRNAALGSLTACTALLALSVVPGAQAAPAPVASASANAVTVTVMGEPIGSGVYRTSNDGSTSVATGSNRPDAALLHGQSLVGSSTLGQDATSQTVTKQGVAWSCAGLAGDDAVRPAAGPECLTAGSAVDVALGSVDLSGLSIVSSTVLTGLAPSDRAAVLQRITDVLDELRAALRNGLASYGAPRVVLRTGAVQAWCTSDSSGSAATTTLDDASLRVVAPGEPSDLVLAALPDRPTADQRVTADLGALPGRVTGALRSDLRAALDTAMAGTPVDSAAVVSNLVDNLAAQLTGFDDDLVTVDLNRQSQSRARAIDVTALDLRVTQALSAWGVGDSRLQVGRATCASAERRAAAAPGNGTNGGTTGGATGGTTKGSVKDSAKTGAKTGAKVPTKVDAGLPSDPRGAGVVLAGGMLVLGLGAGAVASALVARRRT